MLGRKCPKERILEEAFSDRPMLHSYADEYEDMARGIDYLVDKGINVDEMTAEQIRELIDNL